jgi:hypothetical protein
MMLTHPRALNGSQKNRMVFFRGKRPRRSYSFCYRTELKEMAGQQRDIRKCPFGIRRMIGNFFRSAGVSKRSALATVIEKVNAAIQSMNNSVQKLEGFGIKVLQCCMDGHCIRLELCLMASAQEIVFFGSVSAFVGR